MAVRSEILATVNVFKLTNLDAWCGRADEMAAAMIVLLTMRVFSLLLHSTHT